jgi:hypothetical protein
MLGSGGNKTHPTVEAAFAFVKQKFGNHKAFEVGERTLSEMDKALKKANEMPFDNGGPIALPQRNQPAQNQPPAGGVTPQLPTDNIVPDNTDPQNRMSSSVNLKKMMKRFRN